jgi:hypothetical protein
MNAALPAQEYLSPAANEVVKPGMTPCQQAQALNENQLVLQHHERQ